MCSGTLRKSDPDSSCPDIIETRRKCVKCFVPIFFFQEKKAVSQSKGKRKDNKIVEQVYLFPFVLVYSVSHIQNHDVDSGPIYNVIPASSYIISAMLIIVYKHQNNN